MNLSKSKSLLVFFICILIFDVTLISAQNLNSNKKQIVYLIPGQGSDYRLFNNLTLPEYYDTIHIRHCIPDKDETMQSYARKLSRQIDTTQAFSIIGVSLGGMVAVELTEILNPEKVIIVSSAKTRNELPGRYRFMKTIPIHRIFPPFFYRYGSFIAQPLVEPDRKGEKETFKNMLHDKNALFLKRSTKMIVNWERDSISDQIIHIHGTRDHTIPYRNVKANFTIEKGSHMMILTESEKINKLIISILNQN